MNDRVTEIMWKCTVPNEQSEEYANSKGLINDVGHKLDIGKFAELIIEECCDYVRAIDAMEIKKHFGVEE
jgi:hypothetical protein